MTQNFDNIISNVNNNNSTVLTFPNYNNSNNNNNNDMVKCKDKNGKIANAASATESRSSSMGNENTNKQHPVAVEQQQHVNDGDNKQHRRNQSTPCAAGSSSTGNLLYVDNNGRRPGSPSFPKQQAWSPDDPSIPDITSPVVDNCPTLVPLSVCKQTLTTPWYQGIWNRTSKVMMFRSTSHTDLKKSEAPCNGNNNNNNNVLSATVASLSGRKCSGNESYGATTRVSLKTSTDINVANNGSLENGSAAAAAASSTANVSGCGGSSLVAYDSSGLPSIDRLHLVGQQQTDGFVALAAAAAAHSTATASSGGNVSNTPHQFRQNSSKLQQQQQPAPVLRQQRSSCSSTVAAAVFSISNQSCSASSSLDSGVGGKQAQQNASHLASTNYFSVVPQQRQQEPASSALDHGRASLRREKAVDLPSYASADQQQQQNVSSNQQTPANNYNTNHKEFLKSHKKADKLRTSRSKSSNESILKKLIGVGSGGSSGGSTVGFNSSGSSSKFSSADDSPIASSSLSPYSSIMSASLASGGNASAGVGGSFSLQRDSIKPDFSSDSLDFKYEEKLRRRIFAHYDCGSIFASPTPLLNGTSRLEDVNLNAATGASQASRPSIKPSSPQKLTNVAGSEQQQQQSSWPSATAMLGDDPANSTHSDEGDAKSNDVVLSCPFFRNELGGEPIRTVSLDRANFNQQPSNSRKSTDDERETWLRPSTAAEASVLENLSNVYLGGRLCAGRQDNLVIEYVDQGAFYYRHCFAGKAHQNYFGTDENLGPVSISIVRDRVEHSDYKKMGLTSPYLYRIIVRLSDMNTFRGAIMEDSLPSYQSAREQQCMQQSSTPPGAVASSGKIPVRELIELTIPELQLSCLRLAVPVPRTEEMLLKLDEQTVYTRYKVGILYCRSEQCTEEQMYNNETASPAFEEFLDMLGQRVRLKGFDKYKGGLDNKGDTTGQSSLYTTFQQYEVMFHVSTMLPFTSNNRQQLSRKRHIGNDIVTVIFQDPGALPFSAQTVRSHFQHVFIVVRAHNPNTDSVRYSVAVSRCKDVPSFGPPIPEGAIFPKSKEFCDFMLTKIINAENAVHKSDKFATMAARTRKEFMRDLSENHVTSHSLEGTAGKIGKILGTKRRDRPKPKLFLDSSVRGAIVWEVQVLVMVEDFSLCKSVECFMGISADYVVLVEQSKNQDVIFCTPSHSIIGWTSHGNSLKLYYDHAEVIILRSLDDDDAADMQEILKRLQAVTKGCETVEMILRRSVSGQLGFHIQHEGIVSDVEMYGPAWQAGLRQGSRLVEICKVNVASLTLNRMLELLRTSTNIRVLVVSPLEDGSPRRGCEDPYCPSVMSDDSAIAQYLIDQPAYSNRRYPPSSYETAVLRKQLITLTLEPESPGERNKNGFENVNTNFSKSLDELQGRRRHSEELRSNSADYNYYTTARKTTAAGFQPTVLGSLSGDEPSSWFPHHDRPGTLASSVSATASYGRTAADAYNSSGSSEGSDYVASSLSTKPSVFPLDLKRKIVQTHSDMARRASEDTDYVIDVQGAPRLPPKTYKQRLTPSPQTSQSSGQLTVPPHYLPTTATTTVGVAPAAKTVPTTSSSLHENLMRLTSDEKSLQNLNELITSLPSAQQAASVARLQPPKEDKKFSLSPETERGVEWSTLVDAATRAIEGMTQKALSNSNSPEMGGYHLKYQAAQQRIKLLEEKTDRLLTELDKEREAKRQLEMEIITLRQTNKRLEEECLNAQMELKKFTEWFFKAVENTGGGDSAVVGSNGDSPGVANKPPESNNNRKEPPKN